MAKNIEFFTENSCFYNRFLFFVFGKNAIDFDKFIII